MARLLLIDDDPALHEALSGTMTFHFPHVELVSAASGKVALCEIEKQEFDLILCDLAMPGMDGSQVIPQIRRTHPCLRVFLVTGHPHPETVYIVMPTPPGLSKSPLNAKRLLHFSAARWTSLTVKSAAPHGFAK